MPIRPWGSHRIEFCIDDGLMKRQYTWAYSWESHGIWREICWRSQMTSTDTCHDAFTGQAILCGWWIVQRITQVAPEMCQFLDRGHSVMDDNMPLWLSTSSAYWRKSKFWVSEFPLVTQLNWAPNYSSVRLPMLLLRLQKSGKNGTSTFLRFPLHCEYQRMSTGYSPRCSCLAGN